MSRIFGLLDRDLTLIEAPKAPLPHNVILGDKITMVPEEALSPELKLLNDREMASWKFSVAFKECRDQAAVRYCVQLSSVRSCPGVVGPVVIPRERWSKLTDDFSWRRVRKVRFFRPVHGRVKETPVFDSVLLTQDPLDQSPPPPYSEFDEGIVVEVPGSDWIPEKKYGA